LVGFLAKDSGVSTHGFRRELLNRFLSPSAAQKSGKSSQSFLLSSRLLQDMEFACRVRLKSAPERYLGEDLAFCGRDTAFFGGEERCTHLAQSILGENWASQVEFEKLTFGEWLRMIGRKGGRVVSEKKLVHLRRLGRRRTAHAKKAWRLRQQRRLAIRVRRIQTKPKNFNRYWWSNGHLAARAATIGRANLIARRFDRTISRGTLRRAWKRGKPSPELPEKDGLYILTENGWNRVK
jgi:hypothetical protein